MSEGEDSTAEYQEDMDQNKTWFHIFKPNNQSVNVEDNGQ